MPGRARHASAVAHTPSDLELPAAHVDDLGRPPLLSERAVRGEEGLVEPERVHGAEPGRILDERPAEHRDGVHHGVPVRAHVISDVGDRAAVTADLARRPSRGARCHLAACRRDPRILCRPRPVAGRASPPLLAPHQPRWTAEHRQIDQHDPRQQLVPSGSATERRLEDVPRAPRHHQQRELLVTAGGQIAMAAEAASHRVVVFEVDARC